nr:reverse transcriptase domain-containing protein [Tanacetum cinerariifolium]
WKYPGSNEEESSDSEEEEEEHLAPTVPAPAQYSYVSESDETEPFEEGETTATPPPFGYQVERLLAIPTPPLSPKMAPKRSTRFNPGTTPVTTPSTTTTSVTNAQLQAMINEGVNAALAAHFKGTEGVIELTRWFEKMESVFSISNCTASNQVKFATCTLQDNALTWWNSYVKTTTPEEAYAMTWATLKKKMTGKYCPRGEIKKIETEMWNLKVNSNDVVAYNR